MALNRVRTTLTGLGGLPGLSTFYFDSTTTDMTGVRTFWDAIKGLIPNGVSIQVPNSGDQFLEGTGTITGSWSGPAQASVASTGGVGAYLSTAGAMIRWTCNGVVDGRRPIGKTFIIPVSTSVFSSSGTVSATTKTTVNNAVAALLSTYGGAMKLWHRKNEKGAGQQFTILSGQCIDKQVVLRSRRD